MTFGTNRYDVKRVLGSVTAMVVVLRSWLVALAAREYFRGLDRSAANGVANSPSGFARATGKIAQIASSTGGFALLALLVSAVRRLACRRLLPCRDSRLRLTHIGAILRVNGRSLLRCQLFSAPLQFEVVTRLTQPGATISGSAASVILAQRFAFTAFGATLGVFHSAIVGHVLAYGNGTDPTAVP